VLAFSWVFTVVHCSLYSVQVIAAIGLEFG